MVDPSREPRDAEPDRLEHRCEERVVLEAVAASASADELVLKALEVQTDRTAEKDVEVLERDRAHVREVQPPEARDRRLDGIAMADPREVRLQVQSHRAILPALQGRRKGLADWQL